jgi:hypothetical protein
MLLKRLAVLSCIVLLHFSTYAQQPPTTATKDPTAVALATKSLAALTSTTPITDVTLMGTATRTAGSDVESGNVTLKALGTSDSRLDLVVSSGTRSEIRTSTTSGPQGSWAAPNGTFNSMAVDNCFTDVAWFFPALTVLSQTSSPNLSITYVG